MSLKYKVYNIINAAMDNHRAVAIQGCNCFCRQGRGLAAEVARRLPHAVQEDYATKLGDKNKLGTFSVVGLANGAHFVNGYTQYHWFKRLNNEPLDDNGKPILCDYNAIRKLCINLREYFSQKRHFYFPKIGCGLANGTWKKVEQIIKEELVDQGYDVTIFVIKQSELPEWVTKEDILN